jgi:hypothetical protein
MQPAEEHDSRKWTPVSATIMLKTFRIGACRGQMIYLAATGSRRLWGLHDHLRRTRTGFRTQVRERQELEFKATARRNRLLGEWAAGLMGLATVEEYARAVVKSDFEQPGDEDVLRKVFEDLKGSGVSVSEGEVRMKMDELLAVARAADRPASKLFSATRKKKGRSIERPFCFLSLPDPRALLRRQVELVARLDAEGGVPGVDIAGRADDPEVRRRMRVGRHLLLQRVVASLFLPALGEGQEEALVAGHAADHRGGLPFSEAW